MVDLYKSDEWKELNGVDRAQLLLVIEGLKRGTIIDGDYSVPEIAELSGLDCLFVSRPDILYPTFKIANPGSLEREARRLLSSCEPHKALGEFLGYPDCCVNEYIRPQTPVEQRTTTHGNSRLASRFGREIDGAVWINGVYPEALDYRPPSFTPCNIGCEKALSMLDGWKNALIKLDPDAASELVYFNRSLYPQRHAHREYHIEENSRRSFESRLNFIKGSV